MTLRARMERILETRKPRESLGTSIIANMEKNLASNVKTPRGEEDRFNRDKKVAPSKHVSGRTKPPPLGKNGAIRVKAS